MVTNLSVLMDSVWGEIETFPWLDYMPGLILNDPDTGLAKFTGLLLWYGDAGSYPRMSKTYGNLPDPEKTSTVVRKKAEVVLADPRCIASGQYRDKSQKIYAGGFRIPGVNGKVLAGSGQPEIGDYVLLLRAMAQVGLYDKDQLLRLRDTGKLSWLSQMVSDAGGTSESFVALNTKIDRIFQAAAGLRLR